MAKEVADDLDEVTVPGVPVEITPEDSVVTTVENLIARHAK